MRSSPAGLAASGWPSRPGWPPGGCEVLDQQGQLDVLVNNAGITIDRTVRKMSVEDWDRVIGVNLSGAFYLSRAVLQHMLDRGYVTPARRIHPGGSCHAGP